MSEHKLLVFGNAAALLAVSGVALWYVRSQPCPIDPDAAQACRRLRRISAFLYDLALASFALGAVFAFLLPALGSESFPAVREFPTKRVVQQSFPRTRLQNRTFEQGYIRTGGDLWSPGVQMVRRSSCRVKP